MEGFGFWQSAFDKGDGDREATGEPGDGFTGEAIGVAVTVELFVVVANDLADWAEVIDKSRERLTVDGVLMNGCPVIGVTFLGMAEEFVECFAVDPDEADIMKPSAGEENVFIGGGESSELDHFQADIDDCFGLNRDSGVKGGNDSVTEFDGMVKIFLEGGVILIEMGFLVGEGIDLSAQLLVGLAEFGIEAVGFCSKEFVGLEGGVALDPAADGGEEFSFGPGFGKKTENFSLIDGVDQGVHFEQTRD